jgi:hypothetical protein
MERRVLASEAMRRVAVAVALLSGVATFVAFDAWAIPEESWVGSQYGWTAVPPPACKPARNVCSTEDGGRSWHGIFDGGTFVFGVVRTSASAGVVSTGRQLSARFWTRDNGRHWYRTRRIGPEFQGSGKYLFWISFSRTLYQVRPWPPRGRALCRGVWAASAFSPVAAKGGNVCSGRAVEAGMRATGVATLDQGTFAALANVPGGIIATIDSAGTTAPPRILLHRRGRSSSVELPAASGMVLCHGFGREPLVAWPRIAVFGCAVNGVPRGVWTSSDGARSWTAVVGG